MLAILLGSCLFQPLNAQTTITSDSILQTSTCPGGNVIILFNIQNGNFSFGNRFYAEWSDEWGDFTNPDTIGMIPFAFGNTGIIFGTIPDDATFGLLYRIRVVSSNPVVIGQQSALPLFVTEIPFLAQINALALGDQCTGEPVTLIAGVGIGGDYEWNTGETEGTITVTEPGTYSVTVNALGCETESDPFVLTMLPRPMTPGIAAQGNGDLFSTPEVGYQWYVDGSGTGGDAQTLDPDQTGWYNVVTIDNEGCESLPSNSIFHMEIDDIDVGVTQPETPRDTITGITPYTLGTPPPPPPPAPPTFGPDLTIYVYPIPTSDLLHIETFTLEEEKIFFKIHDAIGREMHTSPRENILGAYHSIVDMSTWEPGYYSVSLYIRGNLRQYNILKME